MKKIATASMPSDLILPASAVSAAVSSGVTISPWLPMRSVTSNRSGRGIKRLVAAIVQVERIGPVAARDFEHVAKTRCRDKRRLGALALDQRIDDEGGAVVDEARLVRRQLHLVEAVEDAFDEISVGRRALGVGDAVAVVVVRNEISEGTADIDGDGKGHFRLSQLQASWPSLPRLTALFDRI